MDAESSCVTTHEQGLCTDKNHCQKPTPPSWIVVTIVTIVTPNIDNEGRSSKKSTYGRQRIDPDSQFLSSARLVVVVLVSCLVAVVVVLVVRSSPPLSLQSRYSVPCSRRSRLPGLSTSIAGTLALESVRLRSSHGTLTGSSPLAGTTLVARSCIQPRS